MTVHQVEAKSYAFLTLWVLTDCLVIFGHVHFAIWLFGIVLWIALGLFTHHAKKEWPRQSRILWWIHAFACCILAVFLFLISHPIKSSESKPVEVAKWQPPELPKGCDHIALQLGRSIETAQDIPISELTNGPMGELPLKGQFVIGVYVKGNRLFIHAAVPFSPIRYPTLIGNDSERKIPKFWDQNNNENAFEVVDEDNFPVFQVLYREPNDVVVSGIFSCPQTMVIAFGVIHTWDITNREAIDSEINAADRKPLFKYPSRLHPHELAN